MSRLSETQVLPSLSHHPQEVQRSILQGFHFLLSSFTICLDDLVFKGSHGLVFLATTFFVSHSR